jgi:hypothetical protein
MAHPFRSAEPTVVVSTGEYDESVTRKDGSRIANCKLLLSGEPLELSLAEGVEPPPTLTPLNVELGIRAESYAVNGRDGRAYVRQRAKLQLTAWKLAA